MIFLPPQVDCNMEFFPRYVQKPRAMYTFLCDQDTPRRHFEQHARLHSDVSAQVDYWLEQRCPLAYLGCPFSVVRMRPNQPDGAMLAYIPSMANFTVRYPQPEGQGKSPRVGLNDLPYEILLRISRFLDGISLISLSKVSNGPSNLSHTFLIFPKSTKILAAVS